MELDKINCPELEDLTISNTDFGDQYLELLFNHKNNRDLLKNVKKLDLMDTLPSTDGFEIMKKYPYQTNITYLSLEYNELTPESIEILVQCQALSNLETLSLPNGYIQSEGFSLITKCPFFKNVTKLDVSNNQIVDDGFCFFGTEHFTLKKLVHFKCNINLIGEEGFKKFFSEPSLSNLEKLKFEETYFNDESAEALIGANLQSLKLLDFTDNLITNKGFGILAKMNLPNLTTLLCGGSNSTSFEGAIEFLESSSIPKLSYLDIDFSEDYKEEKKEILDGPAVVETVQKNSLEVAKVLVKAYPKLTNIKYDSYISVEILKIFLDSFTDLNSLCIQVNFIDDEHIKLLTSHPQTAKLEKLY